VFSLAFISPLPSGYKQQLLHQTTQLTRPCVKLGTATRILAGVIPHNSARGLVLYPAHDLNTSSSSRDSLMPVY